MEIQHARTTHTSQEKMEKMEVTVLIPQHVDDPIPTIVPICPSTVVITLHVAQSRIVWRELEPCLFLRRRHRVAASSPRRVAQRHMLLCLLSQHFNFNKSSNPPANNNSLQIIENRVEENDDDSKSENDEFAMLRKRRIRLGEDLLKHFQSSSSGSSYVSSCCYPCSKLILLIQPPTIMTLHFEYHWEKLLIHLEHRLILAQSLAGLYSTLGGGCFMTRRMSTAIVLAQQQQRMALILNDMDMYYKSQINAAYNLIYIGQFQAARLQLRSVRKAVTQQMLSEGEKEQVESSSSSSCRQDISNGKDQVLSSDNAKYNSAVILIRMCWAARVFAKRVEKAVGRLGENTTVPLSHNSIADAVGSVRSSSKTVDDYARIRLVQDQSTSKDLLGLIAS